MCFRFWTSRDEVRAILERKSEYDIAESCLQKAVELGKREIVEILIQAGAQVK